MKKSMGLFLALLVCEAMVAQGVYADLVRRQPVQTAAVQKIGTATRTQLVQQLNKSIELEGYFYDGSIPMLVENMSLVQAGVPIPPDKYISITGPVPSSFKTGAKVVIAGLLQKTMPGDLAEENVALQVTEQAAVKILQPAPADLTKPVAITAVEMPAATPRTPVLTMGKRYALLIGTGMNPANNHVRFWNDLVIMYQHMLSQGYNQADIRVAYANGAPRSGSMPVHYPAVMAALNAAFGYFVPKMTANDELYIFVAGLGTPPGYPPAYWLWGNAQMSPVMFAGQVNRIVNYKRIVVHMSHGYCGAFIPPLTRPKRIIITSAAAHRDSFAHPSMQFNNFNYWYLSALRGKTIFGNAPAAGDTTSDSQVSLGEAYNFTLNKPGGSSIPPVSYQMPQFEDNGAPPSRFGLLPAGGEGNIGMTDFL